MSWKSIVTCPNMASWLFTTRTDPVRKMRKRFLSVSHVQREPKTAHQTRGHNSSHFAAYLLQNLKECWKSAEFWQNYGHEFGDWRTGWQTRPIALSYPLTPYIKSRENSSPEASIISLNLVHTIVQYHVFDFSLPSLIEAPHSKFECHLLIATDNSPGGDSIAYTATFATSLLVSWQHDTARSCYCLPAVQQSTDISCPPGPQQQTHSSGVRRPNDGTDRWTDARQFHRLCSAYYASSVNNSYLVV